MGNQQSDTSQIRAQEQPKKTFKVGCRQESNIGGCYGCMQNNNTNLENCLDPNELNLDYDNCKPRGRLTNKSVQYLTPNEISFFQCSASRNVSKIRYYIKQGVNINILDEERTSPLHVAARHGSYQIVQELLNNGSNVDITDLAGWTPLHVAVFFQRAQVAELLLKKGSNRYIKNRDGQTAYDLIKDQKTLDVFNNYEQKIMETTNRFTNITSHENSPQQQSSQQQQQQSSYQYNFMYNQNNFEMNNIVQNESTALEPQLQSPRKHQYYMYFKNLKSKLTNEKTMQQSYQKNKFRDECDEHTVEEIEMENVRNSFNNPCKKKFMKDYNNTNSCSIQKIKKFESIQKLNPSQNMMFNKLGDDYLISENSAHKSNNKMENQAFFQNENQDPNVNFDISNFNPSTINLANNNNLQTPKKKRHSTNFFVSPTSNQFSPSPTVGSIFFLNKNLVSLKNLLFTVKSQQQGIMGQLESKQYYMNDQSNNYEEYKQNSQKDIKGGNPNQQNFVGSQPPTQRQSVKLQDIQYFNNTRKLFAMVLTVVNIDYVCGIALLQMFQFVQPNNIKQMLDVLTNNSTVSKATLGLIFTDSCLKENQELLHYFLQRLDFSLTDFNQALREFFVNFEVLNDPEKIDILVHALSQKYYKNNYKNKHYFESSDSVHMLAFAAIMLDIEIHMNHKNVELRSVLNEFEQNIVGINNEKNLDKGFVIDIVDNIMSQQQLIYLVSQDNIIKKRIQQFQTFLTILENISDSQLKVAKLGNSQRKKKNMIMYLVENFIILLYESFETTSRWLRIFNIDNVSGVYKKGVLKLKKQGEAIQIAKLVNGQGIIIQKKDTLTFDVHNNIVDGQKIIHILTKQK